MAWGRIDDKMYSHRKTMRIPRQRRCEAMGLWTLANSWCNNHATDGHVPRDIWDEFGSSEDVPQLLVDAGYWIDTEDGYLFVNWGEFNLTSDDQQAKREAEAERKRKWRESKKAKSKACPTDVPAGQWDMSEDVPPESDERPAESALTHTHTHTQKESSSKTLTKARAKTKPEEPKEFADFWDAYPRHEARANAVRAYIGALRKTDAQTILDGALRYASDPNRQQQYTKHPASWLNAECWSDDPLPDRNSRPAPSGPSRGDQKVQNILDIGSRLMSGSGAKEITR